MGGPPVAVRGTAQCRLLELLEELRRTKLVGGKLTTSSAGEQNLAEGLQAWSKLEM